MMEKDKSELKVQVKNLTKKFGDLLVLDDISFNIKKGEFVCVVGPTGCGKTTFLNLLTKLYEPTSGQLLIDGVPADPKKRENQISDLCSEGMMKVIYENSQIFLEEPENYEAASEIMWAGTSAYLYCGLGGAFDWGTHNLGHEISGMFEKTHAATITALWGTWARYTYHLNPSRFARYGERVLGITEGDEQEKALKAIEKTEGYFKAWGMPVSIPELMGRPFTEEEIKKLTDKCMFEGKRETVGNYRKLKKMDVMAIYTLANHT